MFKQLWNDETGAIITLELVMVGTVTLLGVVSGLTALRDALVTELADLAAAVSVADQSYTIRGVTSPSGATASTVYVDGPDAGDGGTGGTSNCLIVITPAATIRQNEGAGGFST